MKRIAYLFFLIVVSIGILSWSGCGSSRKTVDQSSSSEERSQEEEYDEIEKLLGISGQEAKPQQTAKEQPEKKAAPQDKQEDDLITLLEVDEGKKTTEKPASQTGDVEDKRMVRLQNEVDELQRELQKKNMEIADLKSQLAMKEQSTPSAPPPTPTDYSSYSTPSSSVSAGPGMSGDAYVNSYNEALDLFNQRNYQQAIKAFEALLASNSTHSYSDNAQYWIGECYYAMGRFQEAILAFEKVFSFPNSNKNDWAQFKIGQIYYKMGEKERARQEFQTLLDNYPESELVPRARDYLAQS